MRRKLLENEKIVRKWGQLNLSTHRLWIESGNDDNYFLNSMDLHQIQGHSILKYSNAFLLTLGLLSFFACPLSVLILKFASREFSFGIDPNMQNLLFIACGVIFIMIGANFFWRYQSSRRLTLNFQAGARNIYFRLTGDFARIDDALAFSNAVDAQILQLKVKPEKAPEEDSEATRTDRTRMFKIS